MKRVGLYCRELARQGTGPAEYVRAMVAAILKYPDPRLELALILPKACPRPAGADKAFCVEIPEAHRLLQDHWHAPRAVNPLGLDALWLPKNVTPYGLRCKPVVTLLDLAYFRPEYDAYPFADTVYMKAMMRRTARRAAHIVAISEATKRDAVEILTVPEDKISVVYPAVSDAFRVINSPEALDAVRKRLGLPEQFLFFAGSLTPRKNLARLLMAFAKVKSDIPHGVVVTGALSYGIRDFHRLVADMQDRLVVLGKVPPQDLPAIYNLAALYAHVSLYEGFGLTVVEAQACGTAVLNSTASCMPEVGGPGALYVDPLDVDCIADGILRLVQDEALRDDLVRKGFENVKRFKPETSARQLQEILASC